MAGPVMSAAAVCQFLARELHRLGGRPGVATIALPAPVVAADRLLQLFTNKPAVFWQPPTGDQWAALGSALAMRPRGDDRSTLPRLLSEVGPWHQVRHPDAGPISPRFFGGLPFAEGRPHDRGDWPGFGGARFRLPRWSYRRHAGGADLALALTDRDGPSERDRFVEQLAVVLAALASDRPAPPPPTPVELVDRCNRQQWSVMIARALDQIAEGRFEKVVLARSAACRLDSEPAPRDLLERLAVSTPGSTLFLLREADGTFLGASPELLVACRGDEIVSEAVAGTIGIAGDDRCCQPSARAGRRLLASDKDRDEHVLTVRGIRASLASFCRRLQVPSRPELLRLGRLLHLSATIRGELARPTDLLTLARALHPTPAVGGYPRNPALRFLAEEELGSRGWFAGPVGWFDRHGNGELRVALRSGLINRTDATIYAGAGIVAGSDPTAEWEETAAKMGPMLAALGVAPS